MLRSLASIYAVSVAGVQDPPENPARCAIVQSVTFLILWLGKICITFGATFIFYYTITTDPAYPTDAVSRRQIRLATMVYAAESTKYLTPARLASAPLSRLFCSQRVYVCLRRHADTLLFSVLHEQWQEEGLHGDKPLYWVRGEQDSDKSAQKLDEYKGQFDDNELVVWRQQETRGE